VVVGPWLSPSGVSILENNNISDYVVKRIYAGGDQCFVTVTRHKVTTVVGFACGRYSLIEYERPCSEANYRRSSCRMSTDTGNTGISFWKYWNSEIDT
jgi:hypothetical protein